MGDHDIKFGGTFHRSFIDDFSEAFLGGGFYFNTDRPFDVDDWSTWPERLRIRVGKQDGPASSPTPSTPSRRSSRTSGR